MNSTETAKAYVKAQLGLPDNPSDWTYDQRVSYIKALSTYIAKNPDSFGADQVATANATLNENFSALDDTSFSSAAGEFVSAFGDEVLAAGNDVAGIGKGILSTASMLRYLIPIAAVLVIGILLYGFYKKQTA